MSDSPSTLARLLDAYLADLQAGRRPDRAALVAAHPELAGPLESCLAALEFIHHAAPRPGEAPVSLGEFRIIEEIGRGGMGVVYEAEQVPLKRRVALKVLHFGPADPEALERFRREAETLARLHHTHIVPVYAFGQEQGVHFLAMQLIDGQSLAEVLADAREEGELPDPGDVARWGAQAAEALAHAHARGVLHRDVKPSNLLRDEEGRVWLTDFGLARRLDEATLTAAGILLGTPRYMSPEQAAAAARPVDARSDVYSLGATLYELATGRPLFEADTPQQLLARIAEEEPVAPRALRPALPRDLETVLLRCLAKDPAGRYPSAQDLADDLRRVVAGDPVRARRPSRLELARRWWGKRRTALRAALAVALTTAALIVGSYFYFQAWDQSTKGRVTLETSVRGLRAEILDADGRPEMPPLMLPSLTPLPLPPGMHQVRLTGPDRARETYQLFVERGQETRAALGATDASLAPLPGLSWKAEVGPWAQARLLVLDGQPRVLVWADGHLETLGGAYGKAERLANLPPGNFTEAAAAVSPAKSDGPAVVLAGRHALAQFAGYSLRWHREIRHGNPAAPLLSPGFRGEERGLVGPPTPAGSPNGAPLVLTADHGSVVITFSRADVFLSGPAGQRPNFANPEQSPVRVEARSALDGRTLWSHELVDPAGRWRANWAWASPSWANQFRDFSSAARPEVAAPLAARVGAAAAGPDLLLPYHLAQAFVWYNEAGTDLEAARVVTEDGRPVLCVLTSGARVFRIDVRSGELREAPRKVVLPGPRGSGRWEWAPDGRLLRFHSHAGCLWEVASSRTGQQIWAETAAGGAQLAELRDGEPAIVRAADGELCVWDGTTGKERWRRPLGCPQDRAWAEVCVGPDLDGDGTRDLFAAVKLEGARFGRKDHPVLQLDVYSGADGRLLRRGERALAERWGNLRWLQAAPGDLPRLAVLLQGTGDRAAVTALLTADGTGDEEWPGDWDVQAADLDGDGLADLIDPPPEKVRGKAVLRVRRGLSPEVWRRPGQWDVFRWKKALGRRLLLPAPLGDLDGDGTPDFLEVPDHLPSEATARSGKDGRRLWSAKAFHWLRLEPRPDGRGAQFLTVVQDVTWVTARLDARTGQTLDRQDHPFGHSDEDELKALLTPDDDLSAGWTFRKDGQEYEVIYFRGTFLACNKALGPGKEGDRAVWRVPGAGLLGVLPARGEGGPVLAVAHGPTVRGVEAHTGRVVWRCEGTGEAVGVLPAADPAAPPDVVYHLKDPDVTVCRRASPAGPDGRCRPTVAVQPGAGVTPLLWGAPARVRWAEYGGGAAVAAFLLLLPVVRRRWVVALAGAAWFIGLPLVHAARVHWEAAPFLPDETVSWSDWPLLWPYWLAARPLELLGPLAGWIFACALVRGAWRGEPWVLWWALFVAMPLGVGGVGLWSQGQVVWGAAGVAAALVLLVYALVRGVPDGPAAAGAPPERGRS